MRQLVPGIDGLGLKPCAGYHSCQVNEMIALAERHIKPTIPVTSQALAIYARAYQRLRRLYPVKQLEPMSQLEVLAESPQNRRVRIRNAYENLNTFGEPKGFSRIRAFIKWEKFEDGVEDLTLKAPRMIQHRSDEYCYELARYVKPLEKYLFYKRCGRFCKKRDRIFIKGMNSWQIGENIVRASSRFTNPAWVLRDFKKYDASLNEYIRKEASDYDREFYRNDDHLKRLLRMQRSNKCYSKEGIVYEVLGTMFSGENTTSYEDSKTNYVLTEEFYDTIDHETRVNGDDSVDCLEASDVDRLDFDFWKRACFDIEYSVVYSIHDVDFCQCKPVRIGGKWRMVRSPKRVLARTIYTCKNYPNRDTYLKLLGAVGLGELHCNNGVPVLEAWSKLLIRSSNHHFSQAFYEEYMFMRCEPKYTPIAITDEARIDFDLSFGISTGVQLQLEALFDAMPRLPLLV